MHVLGDSKAGDVSAGGHQVQKRDPKALGCTSKALAQGEEWRKQNADNGREMS